LKAIASTPGKVILTGEHFVVYGEPAIVMAVDCFAKVIVEDRHDKYLYIKSDLGFAGFYSKEGFKPESGGTEARTVLEPIRISAQAAIDQINNQTGLNILIQSEIPIAAGMGSSGALAVATVAAVGKLFNINFTNEELFNLSFAAESFVHKKPSGVDQAIAINGGLIVYQKDKGITPLKIMTEIPIVIGNTCEPRKTGDLVKAVKKRRERFPEILSSIIKASSQLTNNAIQALKYNDLKRLGELMNINHGLLVAIGVTNKTLDKYVHVALEAGALGAKLTGAGGGGCMVALTRLNNSRNIADAIKKIGGEPIIAKKVDEGVKTWTQ
jgi:mevalonate kinase